MIIITTDSITSIKKQEKKEWEKIKIERKRGPIGFPYLYPTSLYLPFYNNPPVTK